MPHPVGRNIPLSLPRRFICDLVHFAHQVPSVPMQRRMDLTRVLAAHRAAHRKPGWCAIFTKAYALVAARRPELRQTYVPSPWARLYEHPINVAAIGIERDLGDEKAALFAHLSSPEIRSLPEIETFLRHCKTAPVESIGPFRQALTISHLPRLVRRLVWRAALNTSGYRRCRYLGTFGISVVAGPGAAGLHLLSPLTTALNYGVFTADGTLDVRLTFDHRVLDGGTVARAMVELEEVLNEEILTELRCLAPHDVYPPFQYVPRAAGRGSGTVASRAMVLARAAIRETCRFAGS